MRTRIAPPYLPLLPQEIFDIIIDYAHSDVELLATCSRVCRSWVSSSRFHLFSTVEVRQNNVAGFLDLLGSPGVTFLRYINDVRLEKDSGAGPADDVWDIVAAHCSRNPHLISARSLTLFGNFASIWMTMSTYGHISFPTLTTLTLQDVEFPAIDHVYEFISSFTQLERLALRVSVIASGGYKGVTLQQSHPPPRLISADVEFTRNCATPVCGQFYNWLLCGKSPPAFRRLHVPFIARYHQKSVREILGCLGPEFRHLEIYIGTAEGSGSSSSTYPMLMRD